MGQGYAADLDADLYNEAIRLQEAYLKRKPGLCLLYTSDAADERSSVDLGGRRIIKKKTTVDCAGGPNQSTTPASCSLLVGPASVG